MYRLLVIVPLLLASVARAEDPLGEVSGTEDWFTPRRLRRPVESQRAIRLQAELAQAVEDLRAERKWIKDEQAQFVEDFVVLERLRRGRNPADASGADGGRNHAERWLSEEERRLERAAEKALEQRAAARALPAASAADAAFGSPSPAKPSPSSTATSSAEEAFDAAPVIRPVRRADPLQEEHARAERLRLEAEATRRTEELRREAEERRAKEQRAAERAEADRLAREQEAARKLGGHLDEDGQFVDPDLEGP